MTLTAIEAVRLKAADRSVITRETGRGDGNSKYFKLGHRSVLSTPALEVRINDVLQLGTYTLDTVNGIVTFLSAPLLGDEIEFTYYWSQYTDDEIQYFLDDAASNVSIASAKLLLAIAADASKVAERQSMAGGGGLGAVTIDTSVAARELRNTAQALVEMEAKIGEAAPAEGLTEVAWTEFQFGDTINQHLIRES